LRLKAHALWLQAIALWLQAHALWLQAIALWLQAHALWLQAIALWLQAHALWLQAIALWLQAQTRRNKFRSRCNLARPCARPREKYIERIFVGQPAHRTGRRPSASRRKRRQGRFRVVERLNGDS
jgi:hypothetical protein